jgi:hypothetical protein
MDSTEPLSKWFPELKMNWKYKKGYVIINVNQVQQHHTFNFPLEVGIITNGVLKIETVIVDEKSETFELSVDSKPENVVFDPELWLLFELKM